MAPWTTDVDALRRHIAAVADRRTRLSLLVSGLRWRAGSTLALLLVSVVAVGVGAFGPMYLHSTDQAILRSTLSAATPGADGLTLQSANGRSANGTGVFSELRAAERLVPRPAGGRAWYATAITTEEAGVRAASGAQPYASGLVARTGVCAHLQMVAGSCAAVTGTVVMSDRSARTLDLQVGQDVHLTAATASTTASLVLVVSGLYAPTDPSDAFWWGTNYFGFGSGTLAVPELDDMFTPASTLGPLLSGGLVSSMVQVPLNGRALTIDTLGSFQSALASFTHVALARYGVQVTSHVSALLSAAAGAEHTATSVILVVDLELFLVGVFVVYFVASRTANERSGDVRLAMLRGFRPRSTVAVALAEPLAVVAASVPVALVLAWLATWAGARALFGTGVGASLTWLSVAAAVVGGAVGMAAASLGSRQMIATSEVDVSTSSPSRARTLRVVAETAAVAVAIAAFVELTVVGVQGTSPATQADPLSALAPGLLALALGIAGARLLPRIVRSTFGITTRSASVVWTLATRRVGRRSEFAAEVVLLTLATGLATFALAGWSVNARNRTVQETFAVGAPRVLTVAVRPGVNFLAAVRGADGGRRSAMAAVVESAPDGTTLAVDASRMDSVMSWPSGLGAGGLHAVARRLVPAGLAPVLEVSGSAIRLSVDTTVDSQPSAYLAVDLFDNEYLTPEQVELGQLAPGASSYAGSLEGLCPGGCRLVDIAVSWYPPSDVSEQSAVVDFDVTSIAEQSGPHWLTLAAGLGQAGRWTVGPDDGRLQAAGGALTCDLTVDSSGAPVEVAPGDVPSTLPVVVTPAVASLDSQGYGRPLAIPGLDTGTVPGRQEGEVPALPRVGSVADLVDLQTAEDFLSGPFVDTTTEVWLSPGAPSDITARLQARGVSVTNVDSVAARLRASAHGGIELAYGLFLVAALAAGAMAVGATGFAVAVGARRRRSELGALRSVGIPASVLRRSLQAEQFLCAGTALVMGLVAGLASAAVALQTVPEAVPAGPGPPLELGLPVVVLVISTGAVVGALLLTVWIGSRLVMKGAALEKLGGSGA